MSTTKEAQQRQAEESAVVQGMINAATTIGGKTPEQAAAFAKKAVAQGRKNDEALQKKATTLGKIREAVIQKFKA